MGSDKIATLQPFKNATTQLPTYYVGEPLIGSGFQPQYEFKKKDKNMNKLTDKQCRFVSEYLVDFDSTNSAKRAGYSERSARTIGCDNLNKPYIKIEIKKRIEALCDASFLSRDLIVLALLRESHDRAEGSSASARVSALDKLAKIFGLYMTEPLVTISLEKTIADISRENTQNRVSLLPKDNVNFEEIENDNC